MPNWHDINSQIFTAGSTHDVIRRQYLQKLYDVTGRNIIIYYSGWLQKPNLGGVEVNDEDKNGFMTVIHHLDRTKGLDLILHTPGGETAATESLVDYLRSMFGTNIRAIVPQLAMSAGTMIACACKEILMGKHSSLGPVDPQYMGLPAYGVIEEFERAYKEIKVDPAKIHVWQPIISKYRPTLIGECEKSRDWSHEITKEWLVTGMLQSEQNPVEKAEAILKELSDHALTKAHERHLSAAKCESIGLKVTFLEDNPDMQDAVLSVHHACIHTLMATPAFKIIENHNGVAYIKIASQVIVQR
jgi:ATP-dependent protease ClpP protease subunit